MRVSAPHLSQIAVTRFPTLFATTQRVLGERCTKEDFADSVQRYKKADLQKVEHRLTALPQDQRDLLVARLMGEVQ